MPIVENEPIPSFSLPNQLGQNKDNHSYQGAWTILYFYPKDNTPGCSTEAIEFTASKEALNKMGVNIVGISPDSTASHCRFIEKKSLGIELLSDEEKKACQAFGVWQLKKMAGREYMGVVRTTFLVDEKGVIRKIWNKVRVKGHVDEVLAEVRNQRNIG